MINKKDSQLDSALVIINVVLAIALIATLGYVFWDKYNSNKQSVVDDSSKNKESDTKPSDPNSDLTEVAINELDGRIMTLNYPKDWTVTIEEEGKKEENSFSHKKTITSPEAEIAINFQITKGGGFGGACNPEEATIKSIVTVPLPSGPTSRKFVEAITSIDSYDYVAKGYFSEIQDISPENNNLVAGDSWCNMNYSGLLSNNPDKFNLAMVGIVPSVLSNQGVRISESFTESQITFALSGEDYETAKRILLTLTDNGK